MAPAAKKAKKAAPADRTSQQGFKSLFGARPKPAAGDAAAVAGEGSTPAAKAAAAPAAAPAVVSPSPSPPTSAEPSPSPTPSPPATVAAESGDSQPKRELTQEQRQRIEENRRKAEEKRKSKGGASAAGGSGATVDTPVRPASAVNRGPGDKAEVTPEKTPPQEQRRVAAATGNAVATPVRGGSVQSSGKFERVSCGTWMQYNEIYKVRLGQLRASVSEQAKAIWGGQVGPGAFARDVAAYRMSIGGTQVVLVGIISKDMKSRPNVIDQYTKALGSLPPESGESLAKNLCSDSDVIWLEDEKMRLQLDLSADMAGRLATGMVAAVKGSANANGTFKVASYCLARTPEPPDLPAAVGGGPGPFLALVSGLAFGNGDEGLAAARDRALDFLLGRAADEREAAIGRAVRRVVVCGGTVAVSSPVDALKAALAEADDFYAQLATTVPVDVMPGRDDPSNGALPQMPLHPLLFRKVRELPRGRFRSVSNPFECEVDGLRVLGHSGQPVEDMLRCTQLRTPLEALSTTFEAAHLAPTAPDTLSTQPFTGTDPFVIDAAPHVLLSGGHRHAEHEWRASSRGATGTLCVCVPAFHSQAAVVLIDLRNPKDVRVQEFRAPQGDSFEDVPMGTAWSARCAAA